MDLLSRGDAADVDAGLRRQSFASAVVSDGPRLVAVLRAQRAAAQPAPGPCQRSAPTALMIQAAPGTPAAAEHAPSCMCFAGGDLFVGRERDADAGLQMRASAAAVAERLGGRYGSYRASAASSSSGGAHSSAVRSSFDGRSCENAGHNLHVGRRAFRAVSRDMSPTDSFRSSRPPCRSSMKGGRLGGGGSSRGALAWADQQGNTAECSKPQAVTRSSAPLPEEVIGHDPWAMNSLHFWADTPDESEEPGDAPEAYWFLGNQLPLRGGGASRSRGNSSGGARSRHTGADSSAAESIASFLAEVAVGPTTSEEEQELAWRRRRARTAADQEAPAERSRAEKEGGLAEGPPAGWL